MEDLKQSTFFGGFMQTTLSIFLFSKNTDIISMDHHKHLDNAMIFCIKHILSLLRVGESLKISELTSWNPLATSLALTFNSSLMYFS